MNEQSPHTDIVNDWIIGYLTNSLTPEEMQSLQNWLNVSDEYPGTAASGETFGRKPEIFFRYARSMDRCF